MEERLFSFLPPFLPSFCTFVVPSSSPSFPPPSLLSPSFTPFPTPSLSPRPLPPSFTLAPSSPSLVSHPSDLPSVLPFLAFPPFFLACFPSSVLLLSRSSFQCRSCHLLFFMFWSCFLFCYVLFCFVLLCSVMFCSVLFCSDVSCSVLCFSCLFRSLSVCRCSVMIPLLQLFMFSGYSCLPLFISYVMCCFRPSVRPPFVSSFPHVLLFLSCL
jgi:hypothetical protein